MSTFQYSARRNRSLWETRRKRRTSTHTYTHTHTHTHKNVRWQGTVYIRQLALIHLQLQLGKPLIPTLNRRHNHVKFPQVRFLPWLRHESCSLHSCTYVTLVRFRKKQYVTLSLDCYIKAILLSLRLASTELYFWHAVFWFPPKNVK